MKLAPLPETFFHRNTLQVARDLVGKMIVRKGPTETMIGKIVETEAYLGVADNACHTFKGKKTKRNAPMFLDGGHAYVYLIYGIHHCFNVVTERENIPEAVLIRAAIPREDDTSRIASGPGKLCRFFHITRDDNGKNLCTSDLQIQYDLDEQPARIWQSPRINIEYAGYDKLHFWRFCLADHPAISDRQFFYPSRKKTKP